MHLIFLTSWIPGQMPTTGYEICNAALVDALKAAGAKLTFIGFQSPTNPAPPSSNHVLLGDLDLATSGKPLATKLKWLSRSVLSNIPFAAAKLREVSIRQLRQHLAQCSPFDGIVVNGSSVAAAFGAAYHDHPFVYVAHNVEHLSAYQNAMAASSFIEKALYLREAWLLKRLEENLCAQAAHVFTLSDSDQQQLLGNRLWASSVLPMITQAEEPSDRTARSIECDAALIGTWTWQPNRIGLEWFLTEILPRLPADYHIKIAGSLPDDLRTRHSNVSFVGRVPDAKQFVRSGAMVPLPSRAGTGVQLKSIETFEQGLPAVATPSALRGISDIPDNCFVAESADAFAAAMIEHKEQAKSGALDRNGAIFHQTQKHNLHETVKSVLTRPEQRQMMRVQKQE